MNPNNGHEDQCPRTGASCVECEALFNRVKNPDGSISPLRDSGWRVGQKTRLWQAEAA